MDTTLAYTPIDCPDGSTTLYSHKYTQTYHSTAGAKTESDYVYLENGLFFYLKKHPYIPLLHVLEMGFGTGLNALLTLQQQQYPCHILYESVENHPIEEKTWRLLPQADALAPLHQCPWDVPVALSPTFTLYKRLQDMQMFTPSSPVHVIYYDAFSADVQPELWTSDIFSRLFSQMVPEGILTTYSSKGTVKQALRQAGFTVTRLPGAAGKHHMVRAIAQVFQSEE